MSRLVLSICLVAAAVWPLAAAAGEVTVRFVAPETFADADLGQRFAGERGRAEVLAALERHLQGLARRSLPAQDRLEIEVQDVDLAGRIEPYPRIGSQELRVVRPIDGPRIQLRYRLLQGERVLAQGEERLSDLGFLHSPLRRLGNESLRHEKALLDHWMAGLVHATSRP